MWTTDLAAYIAANYTSGQTAAQVLADLKAPALELSSTAILNYLSVTPSPSGTSTISIALRVLGKTGTPIQQAMVEEVFAQLERNGAIELSVPAYAGALNAQIDALVSAGLMSAADKTAILALAKPIGPTKVEVLGFPAGMELVHIQEAMNHG